MPAKGHHEEVKVGLRSARWVVAFFAVGGLAYAQDKLIVDPWKHAVSALFETPVSAPQGPTRAVGVASFPIEPSSSPHASSPKAAPAVVPVGPPLVEAPVDPWVTLAVGPAAPTDEVLDPWARAPAKPHRSVTDWAFQIREIVDPWARGPIAVAQRDPLIVDPWASQR